MGHCCIICLPLKISTYIILSKDKTVKVERRTDLGNCQLCEKMGIVNPAYFLVSYELDPAKSMIEDSCCTDTETNPL